MPANIPCTIDNPCDRVTSLGLEVSGLSKNMAEHTKKLDKLVADTIENREADLNSRKTAREIQKREIAHVTQYVKEVHESIKGDGIFNKGIEASFLEHDKIFKNVQKFIADYYHNKEEHDRVKALADKVAKETAVPRWFARQLSKVDKWFIVVAITALTLWAIFNFPIKEAFRIIIGIK